MLPTIRGVKIGSDYQLKVPEGTKRCASVHRVGSAGPSDAKVLVVMEKPSEEEQDKEPFSGWHARLLKTAMKRAGIDVNTLRFTYAVRCYTPGKAANTVVRACSTYLAYEIQQCDPDIIVTVGAMPLYSLLGKGFSVMSCSGTPFPETVLGKSRTVFPLLSPSMLFHDPLLGEKFQINVNTLARFIRGDKVFTKKSGKGVYKLIRSANKAARMLDKIVSGDAAIDIETTGLDPRDPKVPVWRLITGREDLIEQAKLEKWEVVTVFGKKYAYRPGDTTKARIVSVAWSTAEGKGYTFVRDHIHHRCSPKKVKVFDEALKRLLLRDTVRKVFWNEMFERNWFDVHLNVSPVNTIDAMVVQYVTDENESRSLADAAQKHTDIGYWSSRVDVFTNAMRYNFFCVPLREIIPYGGADVDATLRVLNVLEPGLTRNAKRLAKRFYPPLIKALSRMEVNGAKVEHRAIVRYERYTGMKASMAAAIMKELPSVRRLVRKIKREKELDTFEFNPNSPPQVQRVLYEIEKNEVRYVSKRTKAPSTAALALKEMVRIDKSETAKTLLVFRKWDKRHGTYGSSLIDQYERFEGYVRGHFKLLGTDTGRLSSNGPNLQNIPSDAKRAYVSRFGDDGVMVFSDYSQAELRFIACMSKDPTMCSIYRDGGDIHLQTMCKIWNQTPEQVKELELKDNELYERRRTGAKAVNFGIAYGLQCQGLVNGLRKSGIVIDEDTAQTYIDGFDRAYPYVAVWIEAVQKFLKRNGYVISPFGRVRHIPEIYSEDLKVRSHAERQGPNAIIQGGASDWLLTAAPHIQAEMDRRKMRSKMILTVHDSLGADCHKDEFEEYLAIAKDRKENIVKYGQVTWGKKMDFSWLIVPVKADFKIGVNWRDAQKIKTFDRKELDAAMSKSREAQAKVDAEIEAEMVANGVKP